MVVSDKSVGLGKTDVHAQWLDGPVVRRKIHGVPAEVCSEPRSRKVPKFKAEVDVTCRLNPVISFSLEYHLFDSTGGGAWPLLLVDRVCLVNSFNERGLSLPNSVRGILCVLHMEV